MRKYRVTITTGNNDGSRETRTTEFLHAHDLEEAIGKAELLASVYKADRAHTEHAIDSVTLEARAS